MAKRIFNYLERRNAVIENGGPALTPTTRKKAYIKQKSKQFSHANIG